MLPVDPQESAFLFHQCYTFQVPMVHHFQRKNVRVQSEMQADDNCNPQKGSGDIQRIHDRIPDPAHSLPIPEPACFETERFVREDDQADKLRIVPLTLAYTRGRSKASDELLPDKYLLV